MTEMIAITILGHGAVGLSMASRFLRLPSNACDVQFYAPSLSIDPESSFKVRDDGKTFIVRGSLFNNIKKIRKTNVLIITLKAFTLSKLNKRDFMIIPNESIVLILCNGMEQKKFHKCLFPHCNHVGALIYISCSKGDSGTVSLYSRSPKLSVHIPSSMSIKGESLLNRFLNTLTASGFTIEFIDNLQRALWRKLVVTSAINGACVLFECLPLEVFSSETGLAFLKSILIENCRVAELEGFAFGSLQIGQMYVDILKMPGDCAPSLYADYKNRRESEISFLNGTISDIGKKHLLPTPCNELVIEKFKRNLCI